MQEDDSEDGEASVSMGPAVIMSTTDSNLGNSESGSQAASFVSPPRSQSGCEMGNLSLSTIVPLDGNPPVHLLSVLSSENDFKPDILMSTINTKNPDAAEDLSISMGPLSSLTRDSFQPKADSSLMDKVERLEQKCKNALGATAVGGRVFTNMFTQTERFQCLKCDEMLRIFDQKILEMAAEFQQQYNVQFQMMEEQNAATEESQKQIKDLMEQLTAADNQLKASRMFLEQQAVEREQEREEAIEQLKLLQAALGDKEKEYERARSHVGQMASDIQHLQDVLKEKDEQIQQNVAALQKLEQEVQHLQMARLDVDEENNSLHQVLALKDKLLEAQADQIAALQSELEIQIQLNQQPSETETVGELARHESEIRETSAVSHPEGPADGVPSLFHELQQMIVHLMRKVEQSTRTLEAIQCSKSPPSGVPISPRCEVTPATSTEDISVKDRTRQTSIDNLRELSPSPPLQKGGLSADQPESTLDFLQQLDGKLVALSRVEEAACKRIADLETELKRATQAERSSSSRLAALEENHKKQQTVLHDVESEKRELQMAHTDLLKRISSLENRLEEQRRNAAMGVFQNPYAEKIRVLSEEKEELFQAVLQKEETLSQVQDRVRELQDRIAVLMGRIQDQEEKKKQEEHVQNERLRHDAHQESSLTWNKVTVLNSPGASSSGCRSPPKEIPSAVHFELEQLRSQLGKSRQEAQTLEQELARRLERLNDLERVEDRCLELEGQLKDRDAQYVQVREQLEQSRRELGSMRDRLEQVKDCEERCTALEAQLVELGRENGLLRDQLKDFGTFQQRLGEKDKLLVQLEERLEAQRRDIGQLEDRLRSSIPLKDHQDRCSFLEHQSAALTAKLESKTAEMEARHRTVVAKLKQELEGATESKDRTQDEFLRQSAVLEAEFQAHQATKKALENLQQKLAVLVNDPAAETLRRQVSALKSQLETKDDRIGQLLEQVKRTDQCKVQVEQALTQLRNEVELVKQVQQFQEENHRATVSRQSFQAAPEGPAAPPDLLAPSFVEFLGSTTASSRNSDASSLKSVATDHRPKRAAESTLDFSLPSSMMGKATLKSVQRESQHLLALGRRWLDQQGRSMVPAVPDVPETDHKGEDPDRTLKAEDDPPLSLQLEHLRTNQGRLLEKIQLLETQLALERLLLKDQREANALQQKQVMELLSQQRQTPPQIQSTGTTPSTKPNKGSSDRQTAFQYRSLKLESHRKNLIFQKRFLVGILHEFHLIYGQSSKTKTKFNRFRIAGLAIVSIFRLRFVHRQWRHRRKLLEHH